VASIIYSSIRIKELETNPNRAVIVESPTSVGEIAPQSGVDAGAGAISGNVITSEAQKPFASRCKEPDLYKTLREELGAIVNTRYLRDRPKMFVNAIEEFRNHKGLPLPVGINLDKFKSFDLVYSCKQACPGSVHLVFVSQVKKQQFIEAYTASGKFKQLPIDDSGIELATIDELDSKGVPFQTWRTPMIDGPWYVRGKELFYQTDMEGLWLKIAVKGEWSVVSNPAAIEKLQGAQPLTVIGCGRDEHCLTALNGKRRFKASKVCH